MICPAASGGAAGGGQISRFGLRLRSGHSPNTMLSQYGDRQRAWLESRRTGIASMSLRARVCRFRGPRYRQFPARAVRAGAPHPVHARQPDLQAPLRPSPRAVWPERSQGPLWPAGDSGSPQQRRALRGAVRLSGGKLGNRNAKLGNAPDPERGGAAIASQCKERKRSGLTPAVASRGAGEGEPFNEHHQEPEPAGSRAGEPGGHRGELREQRLGVDVDDPGGRQRRRPAPGPPLRPPWSTPWSWGACRAGRSPRSRSWPRWSRRSRRCWSSGAARPAAGRSARWPDASL